MRFVQLATFLFFFSFSAKSQQTCAYVDEIWVQSILDDVDDCTNCIKQVAIYTYNDSLFLMVEGGDELCTDAMSVVYNCNADVYCRQNGFAGFQ